MPLSLNDPFDALFALQRALDALQANRGAVLYTALGRPTAGTHGHALGAELGRLLLDLVHATDIRRVVLCGGDTSSHAVQQLGLFAITFAGNSSAGRLPPPTQRPPCLRGCIR